MSSSAHILPDEKELLARITADDEQAFEQIYHHYTQVLFPFLLNKTKSRELAEEIIQDIFLKIWARRKTLAVIENFRSYIFMMAVNAAYTILSRAATEDKAMKKLWQNMQQQKNTTEEMLDLRQSEALVNKAIELLPPAAKRIFLLSRRHGMSHDEIAEELHISKRTVSNQVTESLRSIKEYLKKNAEGSVIVPLILLNLLK